MTYAVAFNIKTEVLISGDVASKAKQLLGTDEIRTKVKPSKPKWEKTKITNTHIRKRTHEYALDVYFKSETMAGGNPTLTKVKYH